MDRRAQGLRLLYPPASGGSGVQQMVKQLTTPPRVRLGGQLGGSSLEGRSVGREKTSPKSEGGAPDWAGAGLTGLPLVWTIVVNEVSGARDAACWKLMCRHVRHVLFACLLG